MTKLKVLWLKALLMSKGFVTWKSLGGFGVTLNWPNDNWEEGMRKAKKTMERWLPEDWVLEGPEFAAGGVMVLYGWPKDDKSLAETQ